MKINVEVLNLTKSAVDAALIKRAVAAVVAGEAKEEGGVEIEVSAVLVGSKKIREINKQYRKIDQATDVLSFGQEEPAAMPDRPRLLGELMICPEVVKKDAKDSKTSVKRQTAWVVVHGILHLLGYDHEKNDAGARLMRQKEEEYLSKLEMF